MNKKIVFLISSIILTSSFFSTNVYAYEIWLKTPKVEVTDINEIDEIIANDLFC